MIKTTAGDAFASARHQTPSSRRFGRRAGALAVVGLTLALGACAPVMTKHGHHFSEQDATLIQPGMNQEQVKAALGTPSTSATVGGGSAYYYISSTHKQVAFFKPEEVDRRVLAVYFNPIGAVERTATYGLKDGKVVNFASKQTPHQAKDENIIRALFRNLGVKQLGLE